MKENVKREREEKVFLWTLHEWIDEDTKGNLCVIMSRWWGKKRESNERQKGNRTSWDEKRHRKDNSWSVNVVVSFPFLPGEVTVFVSAILSSLISCWTFFSCLPVSVHLSSSLSLLSVHSFVSLSTSLSIFFFILVLYSHTSILLYSSYSTFCL